VIALALPDLLSLNSSLAYVITMYTGMEISLDAVIRLKVEEEIPKEDHEDQLMIVEISLSQRGKLGSEH
jgi:hypothetical protein